MQTTFRNDSPEFLSLVFVSSSCVQVLTMFLRNVFESKSKADVENECSMLYIHMFIYILLWTLEKQYTHVLQTYICIMYTTKIFPYVWFVHTYKHVSIYICTCDQRMNRRRIFSRHTNKKSLCKYVCLNVRFVSNSQTQAEWSAMEIIDRLAFEVRWKGVT